MIFYVVKPFNWPGIYSGVRNASFDQKTRRENDEKSVDRNAAIQKKEDDQFCIAGKNSKESILLTVTDVTFLFRW